MKTIDNSPKIYVGTYAKYNEGSLFGAWLELSDYQDMDEFLGACLNLHNDETDPELMFQDWENIPLILISECWLHEEFFKYFEILSELDDDTASGFEIYCTQYHSGDFDPHQMLSDFQESYQGKFSGHNPQLEFAYQYVEDTGILSGASPILESYFDYEAFSRDLFLDGYSEIEGHVFLDR